MQKNKNYKQRGDAHAVLILVAVVGIVGVLGFVGFNAWNKKESEAVRNQNTQTATQQPASVDKTVDSDLVTDQKVADAATRNYASKCGKGYKLYFTNYTFQKLGSNRWNKNVKTSQVQVYKKGQSPNRTYCVLHVHTGSTFGKKAWTSVALNYNGNRKVIDRDGGHFSQYAGPVYAKERGKTVEAKVYMEYKGKKYTLTQGIW